MFRLLFGGISVTRSLITEASVMLDYLMNLFKQSKVAQTGKTPISV